MWLVHSRMGTIYKFMFRIANRNAPREVLYDRLYSLQWGKTTTNNYGFAPARGDEVERFQLQLYAELMDRINEYRNGSCIARVLEISCGRGGGLGYLARRLPRQAQVIGLDFSAHAIGFCKEHYAAQSNLCFVRGHALHLPFKDGSFDLVVSVEASHAYGDDSAFLREVRRVLCPQGRFLFADYRTRSKIPILERHARAAGLAGELVTSRQTWSAPAHSTLNVVGKSSVPACPGTLARCSPASSSAIRACRAH